MKLNATGLIVLFLLVLSLAVVVQGQPQQKSTTEIERNDKYGEGGTLETTAGENGQLAKQIWKDKNGKAKEVHIFKNEAGREAWLFVGDPLAVEFSYDPQTKQLVTTPTLGPTTIIRQNVDHSQVKDWMDQFGTQFAKDGKFSQPWNQPPATATTVVQPSMPPTEVFKKKTDQPSIDPDRPSSPPPELFPKNTGNEPKKEEPKKDESPKTDKTSADASGANTASATKPFTAPGYKIEIKTGDGLVSPILTGPHGLFRVNIPYDIRPGEPFTGSIYTEPSGKNNSERAKTIKELQKYSFDFGSTHIRPSDGVADPTSILRMWNAYAPELPDSGQTPTIYGGNYWYNFTTYFDKLPISQLNLGRELDLGALQLGGYTIPTGGQQGGLIMMTGPFDGRLSSLDFIEIGGQRIPIVTESRRSRVGWNTSNNGGEIKIGENGKTCTCPFNNVSVKLSAPNLHLLRGEKTVLTVVVSGLEGLKQDVPFELVNYTPGVVSMEGGDKQSLLIRGDTSHASDVQINGTYTTTRTLTGVTPGSFNITATVHWKETCKPSMEVMRLQQSAPVTTTGSQ